jgi:hypothetical protein
MDGSQPGFGMINGTDIGPITPPTANQEIIGLEGALESPTTKSSPLTVDVTRPFFKELQDILNFPVEWQKENNVAVDPVVCPPIYGENHALTYELDITSNGWLHQLNKDPRNRVPAGFGTGVIQKNQEDYVARAWTQVQQILAANRRILYTVFSMSFATTIRNNFVSKLKPEKALVFLSPLLKKVKGSPTTLRYQMQQSNIPAAAVSSAFRRIIRPRGAFFRKLQGADPAFDHSSLLNDLNTKKIRAAPPKQTPPGLNTIDKVAAGVPGNKLPAWTGWLIKNRLLLLVLLLIILLVIALLTGAWLVCGLLAIAAASAYFAAGSLAQQSANAATIQDPAALVNLLQHTPPQPAFVFTETDPVVSPLPAAGTTITTTATATSSSVDAAHYQELTYFTPGAAGQDSLEAANFRSAAIALDQRLSIVAPTRTTIAFDIANAYSKITAAVDPRSAYPRQLASLVYFSFNPAWLLQPEHLVPAMAYPDFEDPMYAKLRDISPELLIPNLKLIPPNTISLLVTNEVFIESYMVGLNHEFGKELLWREYPTDRRGSYFRQFWDVKGLITNETGLSQQQLTEKHKDITPLDKWLSHSHMGDHNNRGPQDKKDVVLLIRGELLKKFPNTIIYAQKAHIGLDKNNKPDASLDPVIKGVKTDGDMQTEIKFPIFKAEIDPDIKFFGFELTVEQARGDAHPQKASDDWGWYFIIQQIPGEPRFGMDIAYDPDDTAHITWDDLSWENYNPSKKFIDTTVKPNSGFHPAGADNIDQWGVNSANMAYILYQKPVMIAIHAKEMLANL